MALIDQSPKNDPDTSKQGRFSILPKSVRPYRGTIIKWGVIGYFIRIAMMPLLSHADFILIARTGAILYEKHQLVPSAYPSFITAIFASLYALFSPVLSPTLLNRLSANVSFSPLALFSLYHLSQPDICTFLFVSKIPYLVFDLALAFLLLHMIDDGGKALKVFKLWIVNPISIFICYAMGQFDIIPAFFLILALYFYKEHKEMSSMASIGICGAFKVFGLLFVPPMALIYLREHNAPNLKPKAKYLFTILAVSLLPIVISQLVTFLTPVYYESANPFWPLKQEISGFFGNSFMSLGRPGNPLINDIFYFAVDYSIGVGLGSSLLYLVLVYSFPFVYGLFLLGINYIKQWSFTRVWKTFLIFLLGYYAFTFFHPQWLVLALPLLVLLAVEDYSRYFKLYLLLIPLFFLITFYYPDFLTSVFIPSIHGAFFWPGPHDLLNYLGVPVYPAIGIFRAFFAALCIILIALIMGLDRLLLQKRNEVIK